MSPRGWLAGVAHAAIAVFFVITAGAGLAGMCATAVADEPVTGAALHALDSMPPARRWAVRLELRSNRYDERFDANGDELGVASRYDAIELNSAVFPSLALFGPGASLGTTRAYSEVRTRSATLTMGYGVTDDLTLGFILPYNIIEHRIDFGVGGGNVGLNPGFNPAAPIGPGNFPFAPVGPGVAPLDADGLNQILSNPAFGYGYRPIQSATTHGFGDPTVGGLWRFYENGGDSAVLGLGLHIGIADEDDPDNLVDIAPDDGTDDVEVRLEHFRRLSERWDLRLLARHQEQFSQHVERRVPAPGELLPTAASKERLKYDAGDFQEFDVELGRTAGDWRGSVTWHRYQKEADRYTSDRGTDTGALSADTKARADQWRAGISYSGIRAWQAGRWPLPLVIKLEMQNTYDGRNFPKVRDIYLQFTSFF